MTTVREIIEVLLLADSLDAEVSWGNEYIDGYRGQERTCLDIYAKGCKVTLERTGSGASHD